MSKIIKRVAERDLAHIVKTNINKYYYVDSADTFDRRFETMAFEYDIEKDEGSDWGEVYVEWHDSQEEMETKHYWICYHLERCLQE